MPNLVACAGCGCYEAEEMFFLPQSAQLACGECVRSFPADQVRLPLGRGVLAAMRHILYSEAEKLFSFSLPGPALAGWRRSANVIRSHSWNGGLTRSIFTGQ